MKPVMDQQEGRRRQVQPLSCVHHDFGWLFDFGCFSDQSVLSHKQECNYTEGKKKFS
jgi:hypothetical protein